MFLPLLLYPRAWCEYADADAIIGRSTQGFDNDDYCKVGHWITVVARRNETIIQLRYLN